MTRLSPFISVIDLETTGLDPAEGHAPIEVGRVDLVAGRDLFGEPDWGAGTVCRPVSALFSPGRPIPPESSAIHHLVDADFAETKNDWKSAVARFRGNTNGRFAAFAAHSAHFERQWLTDETTGGMPWICTWKCALRAWPDAPGHSNQTLRYWLRSLGKLPDLDRRLASPAHRAGPDAYVTAFLLRELLAAHSTAILIQWSAEPALLVRVPFGKLPAEGGSRGLRWSDVEDGLLDWVLDRDFSEGIMHTAKVERERRAAAMRAEPREDAR